MTTIQIIVDDGTILLTVSNGEFVEAFYLDNEESQNEDLISPNWVEVDESFCAYRGIEIV